MDGLFDIEIDYTKYVGQKVNIELEVCLRPEQNSVFRQVIDDHHSYINAKDTCNRRINWLVKNADNREVLGAVGINSAILAMADRDKYIGWNKEQRMRHLNNIANNYRFAMIYTGIGSQVLSALRKEAPIRWEEKYGDELVLLETLVKPPWTGGVYIASGWEKLGMTKGYSVSKLPIKLWAQGTGRRAELARSGRLSEYGVKKSDVVKVTRSSPKIIFVKPLRKRWKKLLLSREE